MRRIMRELTPEKSEQLRQGRLTNIANMSAEYQLGLYVGEYIVLKYLPTTSVCGIQTRKVIKVSDEEEAEHTRLNDEWFATTFDKSEENKPINEAKWNALLTCYKRLVKKYLPAKLTCHLSPLNIKNEAEFKQGLIHTLWNCDTCSYSLKPEDITIALEPSAYFTTIDFILDSDA